ncbi:MAG: TonB-dependent receptor [Saprospirales bacterium]|nr:MAG: TonB-dependent receptor [Saprospirales bacterium]
MYSKYFFSLITLLVFFHFVGSSQTGIIRGEVFDEETGEPIMFGNVFVVELGTGVNTDVNGFFTIPSVPEGEYRLVATYLGYDSTSTTVVLRRGDVQFVRIFLQSSGVTLTEVDVSARREQARSDVQVSRVSISPRELRSLPATGGDPDLAQYLPVLPGVIFSGDQGGQLYIRGGSPVQNRVLLDGMTIYNPFHSIGFYSVFDTETIQNVDVYTGGFGAEYGGRMSAVIDITTRDGNMRRHGGFVSVSPFQSRALLEGPILRMDEGNRGGAISYMISAKTSYLDQTSKSLYSYASDSLGLPFSFNDIYGKVTFLGATGSKVSLFGFSHNDKVDYTGIASIGWNSYGGGGTMRIVPSNSSVIIGATVAFSRYELEMVEANEGPRFNAISGFDIGLDFSYFGANSELKYGFNIHGLSTEFSFRNFVGFTFSQETNNTEVSGFLNLKQKWGDAIIEPGIRLHYYASLNRMSFEPRLGAKWNLTDNFRLKAAAGIYSQNLISTVNDRDIVNLFNGYLSATGETIFEPGSTSDLVDSRLQTAYHIGGGFELDLFDNLIEINFEPYYKRYNMIININRNKLRRSDPNYIAETGDAYGIDFFARYDRNNLYLWATYSLSYVDRDDGFQTYPTNFDRRHNVNFLATYKFGKDRNWEIGGRWNLGSGFPFTQIRGYFGNFPFFDPNDLDYTTGNPDVRPLFDENLNQGRLPYYHRLDMSLKRFIELGRHTELELTASVTNVYNRKNIFYYDVLELERVDQLPILPSLAAKFSF